MEKTARQVSSNMSGSAFPDLYNLGTNTGAMKTALGDLSTRLGHNSKVHIVLEKCRALFTK